MYPAELVQPMRDDLGTAGFEHLYTGKDVADALSKEGTTLVVVNSVCGCAAANARPGAKMSLQNAKRPDHIVTVFAVNAIESPVSLSFEKVYLTVKVTCVTFPSESDPVVVLNISYLEEFFAVKT